jgi:hypothetical protein
MAATIKTSYQQHEPLGANFDRDATWIAEHRMELYEKYGDCVILVYHEELIGHGGSVPEAKEAAQNYLSDKEGVITPVVYYQSSPYRIGVYHK